MRKLILILWLAVTPAWAAPPRILTANIPITGINRPVVTTTAGAVHITASPDNAIHAQVTLHQTEHRLRRCGNQAWHGRSRNQQSAWGAQRKS